MLFLDKKGWCSDRKWQVAAVIVIITAHQMCKQTGSPKISSQHVAVGTSGCIANFCHRLQTVGVSKHTEKWLTGYRILLTLF